MKKLLFSAALLFSIQSLFAHALWIETNTSGKIGVAQEVKVFLGEYADNERDSIHHWFSNMKDFTLFITAPDGKKTQLTTTEAGFYFTASFTPTVAGSYVLSVDHTVKEVYSGTKIHYYAQGLVTVNKPSDAPFANYFDFAMQTDAKAPAINKASAVSLLFKKAPAASAALTVQSPQGWLKNVKADANGTFAFSPVWAGRYMLEGAYVEDATGTHEGKEFKRVRHVSTWCVDVAK